jgi:hypothetical protein
MNVFEKLAKGVGDVVLGNDRSKLGPLYSFE